MALCAWCEGRWAKVCPKHVELILEINKYCFLLHLVGFAILHCLKTLGFWYMIGPCPQATKKLMSGV
jgi:hypothetical protein